MSHGKTRRAESRRKAPRKIAFYSVATHLGGAERSLLDLVTRLEEASAGRYSPWLLLPKEGGELVDRLRAAGIPFGVVPMPGELLSLSRRSARRAPLSHLARGVALAPGALGYIFQVEKHLRQEGGALVHTTGIKCHALSVFAGRRAGIPVLWHLRDILDHGPAYWGLRALRGFGEVHLVANSGATADAFIPGATRDGRVDIVHNGLDPADWPWRAPGGQDPARDRLRESLGVRPQSGELLIGIAGVLARWKGQLEFLRMARQIIDDPGVGARTRFAVIGGEIYDTTGDRGFGLELREEARRLALADRVAFTGHVREPGAYLRALDIAVHASLKPEPFGRVIVEAMALGTPLVAARAGGVLEIVEDGRSARLYDPGDVEGMARQVKCLMSSAGLREEMARQARERFERCFTVDRYVQGVIELYDRILSS